MPVLRKSENEFLIYEDPTQAILVAIRKTDQSKIKKYWKSKDKSSVDAFISGFPFIQSDEQETLKIDFDTEMQFQIANLKKFD